jgi:hypothetical protein
MGMQRGDSEMTGGMAEERHGRGDEGRWRCDAENTESEQRWTLMVPEYCRNLVQQVVAVALSESTTTGLDHRYLDVELHIDNRSQATGKRIEDRRREGI